jgi:hypothetical protein
MYEGIQDTAESIRSVAHELPAGTMRDVASRTAETLDGAARYLRDTPAPEMLDDLRTRARAHPAPFLIAAVALGFFVGRLLRQS